MNNRYVNRSKISEAKFRELVKLFTLDLTATQIAELSGLNRNTVNRYIKEIRRRLAEYCEMAAPFVKETDSFVEEIPERGVRYLGIREKNGTVCAWFVEHQAVLTAKNGLNKQEKEFLDMLVDIEDGQQIWMLNEEKGRNYRAKKSRIRGFLGYAKSRLEKFKGIHSQTYLLHLKETEFRYNNDKDKLYHLILKIIRKKPLF